MDASQPVSPAPQSAADERPFAVTNRLVLSIALPMTLAYLTTPLLGLVDTAVIGQYGDAALLGGLAAGTIVFDVVFASFNYPDHQWDRVASAERIQAWIERKTAPAAPVRATA